MARQAYGTLHITALASHEAKQQVSALLTETEGLAPSEIETRLAHLPLVLRSDISKDDALDIVDFFRELGVQAQFTPHATNAKKAPRSTPRAAKLLAFPLLLFLLAVALSWYIVMYGKF